MMSLKQSKRFQLLKRFLVMAMIIYVASFLQFYWSMGHLSENLSSACLDCWFVEEAFYQSLLTAIFLGIIFIIIPQKLNKIIRIVLQFLLLVPIWFFWDYTIFVDRESSWSTFLFDEEISYVLYYSVLPILVLSFLSVFFINVKDFKLVKNKLN